MNPSSPGDPLRDALLDALLHAALNRDPDSLQRQVQKAMLQIGNPVPVVPAAVDRKEGAGRPVGRRWSRWVSMGLAAGILAVLFAGNQFFDSSRVAMAAVQKSLAAAKQPVARQYRIVVTCRGADGHRFEVHNDLYVDGPDRFALRHPGLLPGTSLWLGRSGDRAWVVPAFGPVLEGDSLGLDRWAASHGDLKTPYLHLTAMLERMERGYRLKEGPREVVRRPDGTAVTCRHISGKLRLLAGRSLPAEIGLWAEESSGMAERLTAVWRPGSNPAGREELQMEFVGTPELTDEWFLASGHSGGSRRTVRFESANR